MLGSEAFAGFLGRASAALLETYADGLRLENLDTLPIRQRIDDRRQVTASVQWDPATESYMILISLGLCVWAYAIANVFGLTQVDETHEGPARPIGLRDFRPDSSLADLQAIVREVDQTADARFRPFAEYFFTLILALVTAHELAHITQGHVDYQKETSGHPAGLLDELALRHNEPGLPLDVLRGVEFEADSGAAYYAAVAALTDSGVFQWKPSIEHDRRLSLIILGYTLLGAAMEEDDRILNTRSKAYPEPFLRASAFGTSIKVLLQDRGLNADQVDDIFIAAFQMVATLSRVYPNLNLYRYFLDQDYIAALEAAGNQAIDDVFVVEDKVKALRKRPSIVLSQWDRPK